MRPNLNHLDGVEARLSSVALRMNPLAIPFEAWRHILMDMPPCLEDQAIAGSVGAEEGCLIERSVTSHPESSEKAW